MIKQGTIPKVAILSQVRKRLSPEAAAYLDKDRHVKKAVVIRVNALMAEGTPKHQAINKVAAAWDHIMAATAKKG